ncbi:magnesium-dependent phosphatase 1-like [Mizuhopecten yessoensis]|uniref:Magnesium-dependent phosphatase 1 n=1 Tax=Mizuhopecten yessoensis TaxID=6573 RepID=A0A210QMX9_MIZYE|nr:magnesium-dependent phosphatase 1-like [Mizuhopecten yessoensis]OWF50094.1 Magnesium-dependent phosphatase 1 [Mizuhopecten yessoensis]
MCYKHTKHIFHKMAKPKLIIFDLDYTLWPFWVDTHVDPPFKKNSDGKVEDCRGKHVKHYRDVPAILQRLHGEGYKLGIASRTSTVNEANDLVTLFNWDQYFQYREIYPGCKIAHFKRFQVDSGINFKEMLFFDDEYRNIKDVGSLDVVCVLAEHGMNEETLKEGLEEFASKRGS